MNAFTLQAAASQRTADAIATAQNARQAREARTAKVRGIRAWLAVQLRHTADRIDLSGAHRAAVAGH